MILMRMIDSTINDLYISVTIEDTSLAKAAPLLCSRLGMVNQPRKMLSKPNVNPLLSKLKQQFIMPIVVATHTISMKMRPKLII